MLVSPLVALLAISATSVSASDYATFNLLKDDRDAGRLVFPPTTLAQREVILSNIESTFTAWANYDSKILNYGPASDPFPTIKNLRKNIETITDEDLQLGLTDAFTMIRDHHTRWINSVPSLAEDFSKIQAGDQLLAVNGLSFVDWFEQNQFTSGGGANEFGGQRSALRFLSTRYGEINRLPSEDSITFQFRSRTNPQNSYTVNVPYVSGHDDECWGFGSNLYKNLTGITLPGTPPMSWPFSAEHLENNHESNATHLSSRGYGTRRFEKPEREAAVDRIFNLNKSLRIMVVRSLLANELKDTNSVIYELRGNPGGSVSFSDGMVQLFKPDFHPFGDRYLMNNVTYNLFAKDKDPNLDPICQGLARDQARQSLHQYFQKFPFSNELTNGSTTYTNALTVGVTKTIRVGLYNGQEIEDLGVKADVVFRPRWSDLQPNSTTNSQYDRIAEHLARIGRKNGQSKLHFVSEPFTIVKPLGLSLPVSAAATTLGNSQITIVGKAAGKQVLKTIRSYANNVESSLEAFFTACVGTKVNVGLDVALDTEPEFDFLYLSVKSSGDVEDFLINSKGVNDTTKTFDGVSGGNMTVKGVFSFYHKVRKVFCCSQVCL
ncbi:hypothetical protein BASA60_002015 [Batrachochytrium salamandrivorans]|nr:hypothetical protein BASA60_002015 [Batrachochytrium salamandrivorans]